MEMTDLTSSTLAQKLAKRRLDKMRGTEPPLPSIPEQPVVQTQQPVVQTEPPVAETPVEQPIAQPITTADRLKKIAISRRSIGI